VAVYKNMSRENFNSSYLSVKVVGKKDSGNVIGTKVYLYRKGSVQYQEVNPNVGYLSCVSTVLNFGLGEQKTVDSLRIIWPDNSSQLLTNITANQRLTINYQPTKMDYKIAVNKLKPPIFEKTDSYITYKNTENTINDFKRQPLMLFMYSKASPIITNGDVNNDGLDDIFISGDHNTPGKIYVQSADGHFTTSEVNESNYENTSAAVFFDANGDGYQDLYIAKGGYSLLEPNTQKLQDKLYLNNKNGKFVFSPNALPPLNESAKSCVRPCDYNKDGFVDLFVGGRVIPGQYPLSPKSYLLTNNKDGKFSITEVPFSNTGMVTDAQWVDLNNDGLEDLIICGEFMPIEVYINTPNGFVNKTNEYFDHPENGFWFSLAIVDVDRDGRMDIIAGNLGLNTQIRASEKEPAEMYYADFDNNGSIDPFFNFYINGVSYPFVSRDELNEQMYSMRKKFGSYKAYADVTMKELFTPEELKKAGKLKVNELRTTVFLNRNGKFIKSELPVQAQFSAVTNILTDDFDHDGNLDLLLLGNHSDNRLKLGSFDANYGCLLKGDGKGNFEYCDQPTSGLSVVGDVKSVIEVNLNGKKNLIIGASNESLQFYKEQ
ncbi:MAG TPA: FG-GAP-like repeat-containing protein, partial [Chitinophagaceae bacterium]